ncbi:MAG TPA: tetratricopeptide repeat protein [Desulfurivibrionaceae bacterium]|nr:tetratricopeptide repeat protein [Desulfurivibrionaceae bacterium]
MNPEMEPNKAEPKTQSQLDYEEGVELLKKEEVAQAANAFHNALKGFEEEKNDKGIANASDRLGDICLERGDFATALAHFQRAFAIAATPGDELSMTYVKRKLARTHRGLKQYSEAMAVYADLLDVYRDFNNPGGAVQVFEEMAEMYLDMGERSKAADAYRTAANIHQNFKHSRHAEALLQKAKAAEEGDI